MKSNCTRCGKSIGAENAKLCSTCSKKRKILISGIVGLVLALTLFGYWYYATNQNLKDLSSSQDGNTTLMIQDQIELDLAVNKNLIEGKKKGTGKHEDLDAFSRQEETLESSEIDENESKGIDDICVYFDFNSSELNEIEINKVVKYVKEFKQNKIVEKILIEGYTCNLGSDLVNYQVSDKRVQSVYEILKSNNILMDQVILKSYGKSKNSQFTFNSIEEYRQVKISLR